MPQTFKLKNRLSSETFTVNLSFDEPLNAWNLWDLKRAAAAILNTSSAEGPRVRAHHLHFWVPSSGLDYDVKSDEFFDTNEEICSDSSEELVELCSSILHRDTKRIFRDASGKELDLAALSQLTSCASVATLFDDGDNSKKNGHGSLKTDEEILFLVNFKRQPVNIDESVRFLYDMAEEILGSDEFKTKEICAEIVSFKHETLRVEQIFLECLFLADLSLRGSRKMEEVDREDGERVGAIGAIIGQLMRQGAGNADYREFWMRYKAFLRRSRI